MSKETNDNNPFSGFNLLDGGLGNIPDNNKDDSVDDEIISGDKSLLNDDLDGDDLGTNFSDADKALEEVAKKQAKASSKEKTDLLDNTSNEDSSDLEDDNEESTNNELGFKSALTHLSDKGILDFGDLEIEDSEEGFEKGIEKTLDIRFEKLVTNKLGEEGTAFISFINNGGNPKDFISTYYSDSSWADYNIEDNEDAQKITIRESLKLSGDDEEEIEDMISEWSDNGTLEKRAKTHLNKLQKYEAYNKQELIISQKAKGESDKINEKKYWDDFKYNLLSKDDIKGFKITPKDKDKLVNYMMVTDKTGKTAYQKAIESNTDSAYLFAYLSMNDFNVSKLEKQVLTKASNKLNSLMKNYQTSSKDRISSGSTEVDTEGSNPFAGFRKL